MSLFAEDQIPQDGAPLMAAPRKPHHHGHSGIEQRPQLVDSGTLPHGLILPARAVLKATICTAWEISAHPSA